MFSKRLLLTLFTVGCLLLAGLAAVDSWSQAKPKDEYAMKGGPLGQVKLNHKKHSEELKIKCETCHHLSKPEKPVTEPQMACSNCHVTPAKAPMKTNRMMAFHNPTGTAGTCMDCHKAEAAKGKKSPTKCVDCHKKA